MIRMTLLNIVAGSAAFLTAILIRQARSQRMACRPHDDHRIQTLLDRSSAGTPARLSLYPISQR